jgi:hypothetical protein
LYNQFVFLKGQIMSSTTISRGNVLESFVIAPSITPAALTTTSVQSLQTFPVSGLQTTDIVSLLQYNGNQTSNIAVTNADVTAANTLQLQFQNVSGAASAITPAAGTYYIKVTRVEGSPIATNAA